MMWSYLDRKGGIVSSVSKELLEGLWASGEIDGMTQVSKDNGTTWTPIAELDELKNMFLQADDSDEEEEEEEDEKIAEMIQQARNQSGAGQQQQQQQQSSQMPIPTHALSWEEQWQKTKDDQGKEYHYNVLSMETAWELQPPQQQPPGPLPPLWQACYKSDGTLFYFHTITKSSQFEYPGAAGASTKKGKSSNNNNSKKDSQNADGSSGQKRKEGENEQGAAAAAGDDAENPSDESHPQKKKKKKSTKQKWKKNLENTYVYADHLPLDITKQELLDFFSKCGKIKINFFDNEPMIKMYQNEDGSFKGDARVGFLKEASVENAIQLLDGAEIRPGHTVVVKPAVFEKKEGLVKPKTLMNKKELAEMQRMIKLKQQAQERDLSWTEGQIDDGRHIKIVIIKPMFSAEEMKATPALKEEIETEMKKECSKFGQVDKVTVFHNNPDGVVAVKFREAEECERCIQTMDERFFAKRQLSAKLWDGITNYKVEDQRETAEDEEKRLQEFGDFIEGRTKPQQQQQ